MPFEFQRMLTALVREDYDYQEAFKIAFDDFERRHAAAKDAAKAQDQAQQDALAQQDTLRQSEMDAQRQHEKDLATLKQPSRPPGSPAQKPAAKNAAQPSAALADAAQPLDRVVVNGRPTGLTFQINAVNKDKREIEGYASVWDSPMRDHKIMAPNAFPQKTLDLYMTNPVLLFNHDDNNPVGTVLELKSDATGLWCRAKITCDDCWDMVSDQRVRAFSWMGIAERYRFVPDSEATVGGAALDPGMASMAEEMPMAMQIEEAELWEISVVTLPNSPQCLFQIAKTHDEPSNFSLWAPIRDIETEERMVYGYALVWGEPDADDHVILREDAEPAVEAYRVWSNIREMHSATAVGTAPVIRCDEFGLWVGVRISVGAEECWNKIRDRTYKGFSIGGWAEAWDPGELDGRPVIFLRSITIEEISVCDRPKVAKATFSLIKMETFSDDSISTSGGSSVTRQGGSMDDAIKETLEEKQVGALTRIAEFLMGTTKKKDDLTVQNSANHTLTIKTEPPLYAPDKEGDTKLPPLVVQNGAGEKVDVLGEIMANAAMTKATQEQVRDLTSKIDEALAALKAMANPVDASTEENAAKKDDEDEAEENAAKKKKMPPWMPDMTNAKKKAACSIPEEILAVYQEAVQNGLSRVDAFQATLDAAAEGDEANLDAFVEALGFPESETKSPALTEEQRIACAVKAAMEPFLAQIQSQSHSAAQPASMRRLPRQRNSAAIAQEISGAFGDEEGTEGGSIFNGLFASPTGKRG